MSTPIEQNTTALEELLEIAESLPDATEAPVLQEKSVSPSTNEQTVTPDPGFNGLSKVSVSAVKTATQATPSISVSSSGLITASATQTEGYVSAGTKSATQQMTAQAAQTITPGTSNQTISAGRYLTGIQTILGDSNLVAENIKKGVSIFDVIGTLEVGGGGSGGASSMTSGTFTVSTNVKTPYTFAHDLGVAPDFVFVFIEDPYSFSNFSDHQIFNFAMRKDFTNSNSESKSFSGFENLISVYQNNTFTLINSLTADTINARFTSSTVTINAESYYILKYGITYRWVVGTLS